jgi:hypothetical protein
VRGPHRCSAARASSTIRQRHRTQPAPRHAAAERHGHGAIPEQVDAPRLGRFDHRAVEHGEVEGRVLRCGDRNQGARRIARLLIDYLTQRRVVAFELRRDLGGRPTEVFGQEPVAHGGDERCAVLVVGLDQ